MTVRYNPFVIEAKWQKIWEEKNAFKAVKSDKKYYVLEMLPYPSGKLHVGHIKNYSMGDMIARAKRMQGFEVMHPMGWDSFGLPAENAAIKNKIQPESWTLDNIKAMKKVMYMCGFSYDWGNEITTCLPDYYKHQQALFIDMYNKGVAYRKESVVNWDPVEQTVLANEQVVDGKGWRSGAQVERKNLEQWCLKITDYANELLEDIDKLDGWPDRVKTMQRNWIGKSTGTSFSMEVFDEDDKKLDDVLEVYTTRVDTLMGVTFCSVASEHALSLKTALNDPLAADFIKECESLGTSEESIETAEKKGYKTKFYAVHPITNEKLPIYIANFVLMTYGSGAVMAVPAHDQRDYDFAKKYNINIKQVISSKDADLEKEAYVADGVLINSGDFDGLNVEDAKKAISEKLISLGIAENKTNFRLRDWGMSRQRYWGCPIPFVFCDKCGMVPVDKKDLPVTLPKNINYDKTGNPLAHNDEWKNTVCPTCGGHAIRETDTMDTFMDSSWYFMRYLDAKNENEPVSKEIANRWLPVDQYIGGIEHAVMHLLYARFFTKVMRDLGYVTVGEPFERLLCQGMLIGPSYQDSTGEYIYPSQIELKGNKAIHKVTGEELVINRAEKISKSKNNADDLHDLVERFGADALRLFILFAPVEKDLEWSEAGVDGSWRFLNRVWNLVNDVNFDLKEFEIELTDSKAIELRRKTHKTIKKVEEDINRFQTNTLIAVIMELTNMLVASKTEAESNDQLRSAYNEGIRAVVKLLSFVSPHISEELWQQLGNTKCIFEETYPEFNPEYAADDEIMLVVQLNGKTTEKLMVTADISEDDAKDLAKKSISAKLEGKTIKREIYVPKKLVNIVAV